MTPGTVACQAPLSRQAYWSALSCPPSGHLPNPRIKPRSPALQRILYQLSHKGSPLLAFNFFHCCKVFHTWVATIYPFYWRKICIIFSCSNQPFWCDYYVDSFINLLVHMRETYYWLYDIYRIHFQICSIRLYFTKNYSDLVYNSDTTVVLPLFIIVNLKICCRLDRCDVTF